MVAVVMFFAFSCLFTLSPANMGDSMIANYFGSMVPAYHGESKEAAGRFPRTLNLNFIKKQDMRYGENRSCVSCCTCFAGSALLASRTAFTPTVCTSSVCPG